MKPSVVLLALAACHMAAPTEPTVTEPKLEPTLPAPTVQVEVASVSLAGDCPEPIVAASEQQGAQKGESAGARMHGSHHVICEQTSMQLSLRSTSSPASAAQIQIKRVELFDAVGKQVGTLTPRNPTRWSESGYRPWNERIAAGEQLTASYALGGFALPGSLLTDITVTYRVRVTVAIGDQERTFDKPAVVSIVAPAMIKPDVVT